jgi:hypothetical protein
VTPRYLAGLCLSTVSVVISAQASTRFTTEAACAATLGPGAASRRVFCDVLVGARPEDSIAMTIPPHTGASTLQFDLHNRFAVPGADAAGPQAFARHEAVVAVVGPTGEVVGRAAAVREFRSIADLFDQIAGGAGPRGLRTVAPGPPEAVRLTVPVELSAIGIVGTTLKVFTHDGEDVYDAPGRPVAAVSNLRIEYRPDSR